MVSRSRRKPERLRVSSFAAWGWLALALVATAVPAGAAGARRQPVGPPGTERPKKEELPPIPEGAATTRENVFLPTTNELKLGREASSEVDKEYKIITEGPQYERLQRVARVVAAAVLNPQIAEDYRTRYKVPKANDHARRVPFEFRFKLVKPKNGRKEVNAFSFAGGPVFVTTDLMDYARSDHELAAVLGHECGHVCNHHVVQLVNRQAKAQKGMIWAALASIMLGVGGAGSEAVGALYGAQLYSIAKLTGYGRDLEREADHVGVNILTHTQYSPVGMLTFMKKLARDEARRGDPDFGIYQSHPYSTERTELIEAHLRELKIAFDPATQRRIGNSFQVTVNPEQEEGRQLGEIRLNGRLVVRLAEAVGSQTAYERAQQVGSQLTDLFLQRNVTIRDLRVGDDGATLEALGHPLLKILPGDARFAGRTPPQLAAEALRIIQAELWREKVDGLY
jgi:Zn-dependent protease with chaperone function